ncbi:helix-turn-helix domain-containing protein [Hoeflea alexandrii]|uniref:helix-turn-helix domain-containing protein n=1 Tax=Hoeflea alexandrii TaxID=288436 RepID=UPI0035D08DE2
MKLMTVEQTLNLLQIGRTRLYQLMKDGRIRYRKLGKRTLFLHEDIEAFIQTLPTNSD